MPLSEYWTDFYPNNVAFEYEFVWPRADFKPRKRLTNDIYEQAYKARKQIEHEVEIFIRDGHQALPVISTSPPASTHITARVLVYLPAALEGSGGDRLPVQQAGKDAFDRTKSLLTTPVLNGDGPS